ALTIGEYRPCPASLPIVATLLGPSRRSRGFGDRWLWTGAAALCFLVLGAPSAALVPARASASPAQTESAPRDPSLVAGTCPRGTAPDNGACIHLTAADDGPVAEAQANAHRD